MNLKLKPKPKFWWSISTKKNKALIKMPQARKRYLNFHVWELIALLFLESPVFSPSHQLDWRLPQSLLAQPWHFFPHAMHRVALCKHTSNRCSIHPEWCIYNNRGEDDQGKQLGSVNVKWHLKHLIDSTSGIRNRLSTNGFSFNF